MRLTEASTIPAAPEVPLRVPSRKGTLVRMFAWAGRLLLSMMVFCGSPSMKILMPSGLPDPS